MANPNYSFRDIVNESNNDSNSSLNSANSFNYFSELNSNNFGNNLNDLRDEITNNLNLLHKNNSDIVLSLTRCFICLSISINPLTCPKCNNFACEKCLKKYFGYFNSKKCPLCKQNINYSELKKNEALIEIENILAKEKTVQNKLTDLSYMLNKQKLKYVNKENKLKDIINKILEYQEKIKSYRKEYEAFFLKCKKFLDQTFDEYERKINEVFNLLFSNKEDYKDLNIKNKASNNIITSPEEKTVCVIKDILSYERKAFNNKNKNHFNDEHDKDFQTNILTKENKKIVLQFLSIPFLIEPNISYYNIGFINIDKKHLKHHIKKKGYNEYLGDFFIQYFSEKEKEYSYLCEFRFSSKKRNNMNLFLAQKKIINKKFIEAFPMKFEIDDGEDSLYESEVNFDEFKKKDIKEIAIEIKLQVFSINNNY